MASSEKYTYPIENVSLFNMSPEHARRIMETQKECCANYTPPAPLRNTIAPFFASKLHTKQEIESELRLISGGSPAEKDRKAQQIFARASKELRRNPEKMLQLIAKYPKTIRLVDSSLMTTRFFTQAIARHPLVYNYLPREAQENQEIIDSYRASLKQNPYHIHIANENSDPVRAELFPIAPECPMDKFATLDAYRQEVTDALLNNGVEKSELSWGGYTTNMGATTTMITLIRDALPHQQQEMDKIELEVFEAKKNEILERARFRDDSAYARNMHEFFEKHGLKEFQKEYERAAWHNYCRRNTYTVPVPATIEKIAQECPRDIAEQYFDMEKRELPTNNPAMIDEAKRAADLQQRLETDPQNIRPKEILHILSKGPVSVAKENLDLEACLKSFALRVERAEADEVAFPIENSSRGKERDQYQYEVNLQKQLFKDFSAQLAQYPEYAQIYEQELSRLRTERATRTQTEKDLCFVQQWAFEYPHGSRQLDYAILQIMRENNPNGYEQHLDAKDYLERRTEYLSQNKTYVDIKKELEEFKALVATSPYATDIVKEKLTQMGVQSPEKWLETPLSKFAFSQDKSPTVAPVNGNGINRNQEIDAPEQENGRR